MKIHNQSPTIPFPVRDEMDRFKSMRLNLTESETEDEEEVLGTLRNVEQWLHHCIEVQGTNEYKVPSSQDHQNAIDAMVASKDNSIRNKQDIAVHVTKVPKNDPFDFDSVHHLRLPPLVEEYPLVLDMVYQEGSSKCFVRVKTDLTVLDGVSALHAGFNLLEYLETKAMSPYPFTTSNPPLPKHQMENFQQQLKRIDSMAGQQGTSDGTWTRSPSMPDFEDTFQERPSRRYTAVDASFKTIMQRIDQAKELLNIPFYAVTVNYSPATALSLCPTLQDAMDREKRASYISLPPTGTGPPAPMNAAHVKMLFNTIFFNNYGKHVAPKIQGRVVGYTWDWSGMMKSFPPFFHVTKIQDKIFFRMSAAPPDMKILEESKLFDDIGTYESFQELPIYKASSKSA